MIEITSLRNRGTQNAEQKDLHIKRHLLDRKKVEAQRGAPIHQLNEIDPFSL